MVVLTAHIQRPAWREQTIWLWLRMPQFLSLMALPPGPQPLPTEEVRVVNTGYHSDPHLELPKPISSKFGEGVLLPTLRSRFCYIRIWVKRKSLSQVQINIKRFEICFKLKLLKSLNANFIQPKWDIKIQTSALILMRAMSPVWTASGFRITIKFLRG